MRPSRPLLLALVLLGAAAPAAAGDRPVVVELFTSQSCSSCPPAEALLAELAREPDILPLAFHVTYWNHLDWRDGFSLPAATARQEAYAARLNDATYTPQAVIDGRTGLVGSDTGPVRAAIGRARADAATAAPVRLSRAGGGLVVHLGAGPGRTAAVVTLVGFDPRHTTRVARGENAGRTLVQANVVRAVREIGRWDGTPATLSVPVPEGVDAAVIVQAPDGRILGAARLAS